MKRIVPIGQQINAVLSKRTQPREPRRLKHYRFPRTMLKQLAQEACETNRPQTRILEIAFAHYMLVKRKHRPR